MPLRKPWYSKNNTYGKIRAAAEAVAQNPNNNKLKNNLRNLVVKVAQGQNLTAPAAMNNRPTNVTTNSNGQKVAQGQNLTAPAAMNNRPTNVTTNSNGQKFAKKKNNKWYMVNGNGSNDSPYNWRANGQPYNKVNNKFVPANASAAQAQNNNTAGAGNKNGVTIGRFRRANKNGLLGKAKVGNSIRNVYRQEGVYYSTAPNSTNVFRRIEPSGRFAPFSKQFKYVNVSPNMIKTNNGKFRIKNLTPPGFGPPPAPSSKNAKVNAFKTWWATQTAREATTNARARNYIEQGKNSNIWIPANATNMRDAASNNKNFWAEVNRLNATPVPPVKSNEERLAAAKDAAFAERLAMSKKLTEWLYNKQLSNRNQPVKWAGNFMSNQNYSSFRNRNMNVNYTGKYNSVSKENRNAFWNAVNKLKTAVNTASANATEAHPLPLHNNVLESHPIQEN